MKIKVTDVDYGMTGMRIKGIHIPDAEVVHGDRPVEIRFTREQLDEVAKALTYGARGKRKLDYEKENHGDCHSCEHVYKRSWEHPCHHCMKQTSIHYKAREVV